MTEEKQYVISVWMRQPARKIRLSGKVGEGALNQIRNNVSSGMFSSIHGHTKAGHFVVIPASNVAYIEAVPDRP